MSGNFAARCEPYKGSDLTRSLIQLFTTVALFIAAGALLLYSVENNLWLVYAVTVIPAGGLLVRLFIIQHDCGHGSFFKKKYWNDFTGRVVSLFTFTPYGFWRRTHNLHHAGSGNLGRRGYGGIETLTVAEYKALPPGKSFMYRFYRNPFFLLIIGTPLFLLICQRFPLTEPFFFPELHGGKLRDAWQSVLGLNAAIFIFYGAAMYFTGVLPLIIAYVPVLVIASWVGGWLFFIQHQFEDTLWNHREDWTFEEAAVYGSSYYDLHPVLRWFTGNIGVHHIHHLCAMIPNYRLQECLAGNPEFQTINRITFKESLKCARLALWDEGQKRLVSFREAMSS